MKEPVSHLHLYARITSVETRIDNLERHIEKIDTNVTKLTATADMGKGAWWAATKLGGIILFALAVFSWLWNQIRPLIGKWGG